MSCVLVDGRLLKLPRYLVKDKIKNICKRIIVRKYGYIWYKKTVSNVLPSTALKHYKYTIKYNGYKMLKQHWYRCRVFWRLNLRAKLHHALTLKQNVFRRWFNFVLEKKISIIKWHIAEAHYNKIVKARYFLRFINFKNITQLMTERGMILKTYFTYLYLNQNALLLFLQYAKELKQYYLKHLYVVNFKKRKLPYCFEKLKQFAKYNKSRRYKLMKAKQFFLQHFKRKYLRTYFSLWKTYVEKRKVRKELYKQSEDHLNKQIMRHAFQKLQKYARYHKLKVTVQVCAHKLYFTNIQKRAINLWKLYVEQRLNKMTKLFKSEEYYLYKLKKSCFLKLFKNKIYQQLLREKLETFMKTNEYKIKCKYFFRLKKYIKYRHVKAEKCIYALEFYNKKLVYRSLKILKRYRDYKKIRKIKNCLLLNQFFENKKLRLLSIHFQRWKRYIHSTRKIRFLLNVANTQYKSCLLSKCFKQWLHFVSIRKKTHIILNSCRLHYSNKLTHATFYKWYQYTKNQKIFATKIELAKQFYTKQLQQKALATVLVHGFHQQQKRKEKASQSVIKTFYLTLKYFRIWKYKVLQKILHENLNRFDTCRYNKIPGIWNSTPTNIINEDVITFKWNPMCFVKPKVPDFLSNAAQYT